jgi:pimeloyl-ACP methyl ester carboxylesterase
VSTPLATGARKRREVFASRDEAYRNYAAKPPLDVLDPRALHAYVDHGFVETSTTARSGSSAEARTRLKVYAMSTSHTAFDHLDEVRCPVVIAAGAPTEGGPASFAQAIAIALPQGSFEQHPDLGHFGPLEAPDLIAERVREVFGR